jgi:signal transduction histidine kinase
MAAWQSIRFRLSVQYSAVVFGLGGALLGLVYLAVRRGLQSQTMTQYVWAGRRVTLPNGREVILGPLREVEVRAIESIYNEVVLNEVARFTLFALLVLFLLSLIVGWVMSGRVLRPVEEITEVAREIEASDLSRRISLRGPDDELTRLANTFDSMLERLDSAFSSQRRFLADTSHDLRTPLAVIRSNVELVLSDPSATPADWEKAGGIIRRNAEKMSEMIDGLLAAARLQTGRAQAVTLDLAELVRSKTAEIDPVAAVKGISVEAKPGDALVQGVEVSLDRALANLMDNAIAASAEGSSILVASGKRGGWAWMGVEDQGPGLDESQPRGFGLSIVEQIAEFHEGVVRSYPGSAGSGTAMVVWLPLGDDVPQPPGSSPFIPG